MKEIELKIDEILKDVFSKNFSDEELKTISYKKFPQWDSVAQMTIITRVEEAFGFFIPFDEMMAISNRKTAIEYVQSKIK